ncbi:unnamed protein product [Trichobilharzia regenti]|nr:unnamed protein product [Trichobilharzia regenti]
MCLLCASLAWLDKQLVTPTELAPDGKRVNTMGNWLTGNSDNGDDKSNSIHQNLLENLEKMNSVYKIIFASRTHSQLAQAINALKTTVYSK